MNLPIPSPPEVTRLLQAWSDGDKSAFEELAALVEAQIHQIAQRYLRQERSDCLLQTTSLINEVYLRLLEGDKVDWQNRAHFFGLCAKLMRNVLVDYARKRNSQKRGGGMNRVAIEEVVLLAHERGEDLVRLDEALTTLATFNERQSQVVELRFFAGLTTDEIADLFEVSSRTIEREWVLARAWLYRELAAESNE